MKSKELKTILAQISRRLHIEGAIFFYFDVDGYEGWLSMTVRDIFVQFPMLEPTISVSSPTECFLRCVLLDGGVVTFIVRGAEAFEIGCDQISVVEDDSGSRELSSNVIIRTGVYSRTQGDNICGIFLRPAHA